MTKPSIIQSETPPPGSAAGGGPACVSGPPSKVSPTGIADRQAAIREGIRLERSRVIAMLLSGQWKHEPCQDAAGLIMNGMHWEEKNDG